MLQRNGLDRTIFCSQLDILFETLERFRKKTDRPIMGALKQVSSNNMRKPTSRSTPSPNSNLDDYAQEIFWLAIVWQAFLMAGAHWKIPHLKSAPIVIVEILFPADRFRRSEPPNFMNRIHSISPIGAT